MNIPSYKLERFFADKKDFPGLSLLYAEDQGLVDFYQSIVFKKLEAPSLQTLTQEDVLSAKKPLDFYLSQGGFFSASKDLLIKSCTDKIVPLIRTYLEESQSNRWGRIFFQAGYLKPASKLRQLFEGENQAIAVGCYAPEPALLMGQIQGALKHKTPASIDREALRLCADRLSDKLYLFDGSLEALAQYCWGQPSITKEDVDAVLVSEEQGQFEAFLNAFIQKKLLATTINLKKLFRDGHNVISQVRLLSFFMHRFLTLKAFMDEGLSFEVANKKVPMPFNFFQIKVVKPAAGRWTLSECQYVLKMLESVELRIKKSAHLEAEDLFLQSLVAFFSKS